MAVEPGSKTLRDYQNYYHRQVIGILVGILVILLVGLGILLHLTGAASVVTTSFWLIILVVMALGLVLFMIAMRIMARPLCELLAALSHKIGEPTTDTPPNPNSKHYEKTGFKTALQAVYEASPVEAVSDTGLAVTPSEAKTTFLTQSLNHTSCGVVILNSHKQVIFANGAAPIARDVDGENRLALDFLNEQTIDEWLEEVSHHDIKAERRWCRVATRPGFAKKTKIYDVIASYEKATAGETIIFLIDKTNHYLPEEEDLNFIAFAAHELRGPITVIRGYLDIIADEFAGRLQGDEQQLMDRLVVSANRLSSYIDNILNVSRFDRHHLKVHLLEDTIANIYASIADDMQLRASTQQRLLSVNIPDDLPTVAADRGSISEVISNLIDNAIKYSFEGGTVQVTAEKRGDFVEVSVIDNGIGMPANVVNNLFHKFYRSHRSREAVAGSGIGLYICKAFIESHGGSITARSKENEGSTFSFTLPIYATVKDKLLEDGQLNNRLIRKGGGWIKNHAMYRD